MTNRRANETPLTCGLSQRVLDRLAHDAKPGIRPVINATGVILHTNLGRAPFSKKIADAVHEITSSYSSLEYNFEQKSRGHRNTHVEKLVCELLDVEAAIVVNNNAAGVLLVLSTLARNREVIVSRGELVEIGGSFRIPEIMEESRAILRGVGTTNRTHLHDYERALTEETAALLRVHTSNFRLIGFTKSVSTKELADLAHRHDLPLIYDLGSGCLSADLAALLPGEPTVASSIEDGADAICFSGDKLLGGRKPASSSARSAIFPPCGHIRSSDIPLRQNDAHRLGADAAPLLRRRAGASTHTDPLDGARRA